MLLVSQIRYKIYVQSTWLVEPYMCLIDKLSGLDADDGKQTWIKLLLDKMIGL